MILVRTENQSQTKQVQLNVYKQKMWEVGRERDRQAGRQAAWAYLTWKEAFKDIMYKHFYQLFTPNLQVKPHNKTTILLQLTSLTPCNLYVCRQEIQIRRIGMPILWHFQASFFFLSFFFFFSFHFACRWFHFQVHIWALVHACLTLHQIYCLKSPIAPKGWAIMGFA